MADLETAQRLLEELRVASFDAGAAELEETRAFAAEHGFEGELMNWDASFWGERMKEAKFDMNDEMLRPYFALPNVLDGLFSVRTVVPCSRMRSQHEPFAQTQPIAAVSLSWRARAVNARS